MHRRCNRSNRFIALAVLDYGVAHSRGFATSAQQTSKSVTDLLFSRSQGFVDIATKKSRAAHDAVVVS